MWPYCEPGSLSSGTLPVSGIFMAAVGTVTCLRQPIPEVCTVHSDFLPRSVVGKGVKRVLTVEKPDKKNFSG